MPSTPPPTTTAASAATFLVPGAVLVQQVVVDPRPRFVAIAPRPLPDPPPSLNSAPASSSSEQENQLEEVLRASEHASLDLDAAKVSVEAFKAKRERLGLSQAQAAADLSALCGVSASQSFLCRLEGLEVTPRQAEQWLPAMVAWTEAADDRWGCPSSSSSVGPLGDRRRPRMRPRKERKKRENFTSEQVSALKHEFATDPLPNTYRLEQLAKELGLDQGRGPHHLIPDNLTSSSFRTI